LKRFPGILNQLTGFKDGKPISVGINLSPFIANWLFFSQINIRVLLSLLAILMKSLMYKRERANILFAAPTNRRQNY
jgi:hypothetical protein